jgi:hypothetical protein
MLLIRCFFGLLGVFEVALVDFALYVAYIPNVAPMPGLSCFHGCFHGLDYVVLSWFDLSDCLCLSSLILPCLL